MSRNSKLKRQLKKNSRPKKKPGRPAQKALVDDGTYAYHRLENNLTDLSQEDRKRLITETGERARAEFPKNLAQLQSLLKKYDPLVLMSIIARDAVIVPVGAEGITHTEPTGQISRQQAELLQALISATPGDDSHSLHPFANTIQEICDLLESATSHFPFSRFDAAQLSQTKEEQSIRAIMEKLRLHTQAVRNWGFYSQQVRIIRELYAPLDPLLEEKHGFSFSLLVDLFTVLTEETQNKINDWFERMHPVARIRNPVKLARAYHSMLGAPESEAQRMIEQAGVRQLSHSQVLSLCLSHYEGLIQYAYLIEPQELAQRLKCSHETVLRILRLFSLSRGELHEENIEFFFLNNPVWSKPVYRDDEDFYCFMPEIMFSFAFSNFDALIEDIAGERLKERRSAYLEEKIEVIVKQRFPATQVYSGVEWDYDGRRYETDLIAVIDSLMLIIEAKSHKISASALRGAPGRVRNHLKDMLIAPNLQSHRFERVVNEAMLNPHSKMALNLKLPFDITEIRQIFRLSVSLEDFAALQSNMLQFKDTGWLPKDFVPCPSINLGDLETVFDILDHPIDILHYFRRRSQLETEQQILGDELDFLGTFLNNHLHFPVDVINSGDLISISGNSSPIDRYYMSNEVGYKLAKPSVPTPQYFRAIFTQLERSGKKGWSEIGLILSSLPAENMKEVAKQITELKKIVKRNWKKDHINTLIYQPPAGMPTALAVVVYKSENKYKRHDDFRVAAQNAMSEGRCQDCLVIGINVDDSLSAYHDLMLARARAV